MKAEVFRDQRVEGEPRQWRFRIVADNGEIVAQSEAYKNRQDAMSMAAKLSQASWSIFAEAESP